MTRKRDESGFSLIELMVVIAIVAILAAIGTPNYLSWRVKKQLSGAVTNLKADLEMGKARAIHRSTPVAVMFNANGYRIFTDISSNSILDGNDDLVVSRTLASGVTVTLPAASVRFNSRGLALPASVVTITNARGSGQVDISVIGTIRILNITYN